MAAAAAPTASATLATAEIHASDRCACGDDCALCDRVNKEPAPVGAVVWFALCVVRRDVCVSGDL